MRPAGGGWRLRLLAAAGLAALAFASTSGAARVGEAGAPPATTLTNISSIGAALTTGATCARLGDGTARCWGDNGADLLGENTDTTLARAPVEVCESGEWSVPDLGCSDGGSPSGLGSIEQLSVGGDHACALITGGAVKCWGQNGLGQLGDGLACGATCATPVDVVGLQSGVVALSSGMSHSCALLEVEPPAADYQAVCWGYNHYGQLGEGHVCATHICPTPQQPLGMESGVAQVGAGGLHTCAVMAADGAVKCWGYNGDGGVGDGTGSAYQNTPIDVCAPGETAPCPNGLTGAVSVGLGSLHSCARMSDGSALCWGDNAEGQLGDGTTADALAPVAVCAPGETAPCATTLTDVSSLSGGFGHTCAIVTGGVPLCWGSGEAGQTGNGLTGGSNGSLVPANVCAAGSGGGCTVLTGVQQISAGNQHTCALMDDRTARCWGENSDGELGNNSRFDQANPVSPTLDTDRDGCADEDELQTAAGSQVTGGLRSATYHWDFYDVWTADMANPGGFVRDQTVTLAGDILQTAARFGPVAPEDTSDQFSNPLTSPPPAPAYHPAFDRGPVIGPNVWDRAPPDGVIGIPDDILGGTAAQYGHNCG